jgi:alkaline phosphatase
MSKFRIRLFCGSILGTSLISATVWAAPSNVSVTPPNNARFIAGQRFDLRVEGKGVGPFLSTLTIDGVPQTFTSGTQNSVTTDGITSNGYGGFNLRGYSNLRPGRHQIVATFTDATGTSKVESSFEIEHVGGFNPSVRNIIILLGDGMGTAHRTAARLVRYGATLGDPNGYLAMDGFPATGMITTHSLNSVITDSAPGMSGYVSGTHQKNGQEGVYPANVVNPFFAPRVEYLSEFLHRRLGRSLGLVTTADVEDATPAANAVHTANRSAGTGIVDQYFDESDAGGNYRHGTGLKVLMGGGRRWFLPSGEFGSSRADSSDYPALPADLVSAWNLDPDLAGSLDSNRDLISDFTDTGFSYAESATELTALTSQSTVPEKLLGLFAYGNMNVALDKLAKRRNTPLRGSTSFVVDEYHAPDQPMLDEMTAAALKVLSRRNTRGFTLLVEGAHIDKQSHAMDAERAVGDTIEFDRAVAVARHFADNVDSRTLVIVLADHECSGFSIIGALNATPEAVLAQSADGSVLDPNTKPGRQGFVGTYDSAGFPVYNILADGYPETYDVAGKLLFGFGANGDRYETWLTQPKPIIDSLLSASIVSELNSLGYPKQPANRSNVDGYFIRGQAVGRDQAVHTATDIPISAYSPRSRVAQQFVGVQRNTDVFAKLMRAALGGY